MAVSKTCLITGADSGLGKAVATSLAKKGYQLVLVSNDENRLKAAREEIIALSENSSVEIFAVDLSWQCEIREFCKVFNNRFQKLDLLINNAGVNIPFRKITAEGFEYMYAVNHLAPFLLTILLMDNLKAAGKARIINIGSNGEKYAKLDFENLQGENSFNSMKQYCLTKLCNLMFTYQLATVLEGTGITVSSVHPGGVRTGIMKNYNWFSLSKIAWHLLYPFLKSPQEAGRYVLNLINYEASAIQGKYFLKGKIAKSSPTSLNKELSGKLWEITCLHTNQQPDWVD